MKLHLVTTPNDECGHRTYRPLGFVRQTTPWLEWNRYRRIVCLECGEWLVTEKYSALEKQGRQQAYTQPERRSSEVGGDFKRYS